MSDRDEERTTVQALFDRIVALDAEGVADLFAEDGRQAMPFSPPGFPGSFEGREELRANYRTLLGGYASVAFPDLVIEPLAARGRWLATYRTDIAFADGRRYRNRYIALLGVDDGHVTEWIEYFDPITLTKELGNPFAAESATGGQATVRAYLDRLAAFDIEGWGALLTPDAVQDNPYSPPNFPARFEGWDAIMEHHRSLPGTFEAMTFSDVVLHDRDDGAVVAEFLGHIALKGGGRYDNRYISIFSFAPDGRIREVREYFNPLVLLSSFKDTAAQLHGLSDD